jgi:hypothetical protein
LILDSPDSEIIRFGCAAHQLDSARCEDTTGIAAFTNLVA